MLTAHAVLLEHATPTTRAMPMALALPHEAPTLPDFATLQAHAIP
jgi:hypothetical protein